MDAREYVTLTNSASKRALFPSRSSVSESSGDEDSLGHMSPLKDSSPDRYSSPRYSPAFIEETPCKMDTSHDISTKKNLEVLRVCRNFDSALGDTTPQKMFTDIVGDTPVKDTSDMLTPFKCLIQRRNIEETPDSTISKSSDAIRKLFWKKKEQVARSPEKKDDTEKKNFDFNSSIANLIKSSFYRPANSRAKTSLFPENAEVRKPTVNAASKINRRRHVNYTHHSSNFRNAHKRSRLLLGEINAGVRHRVKRPKPKIKRNSDISRKSTEKPLISPEDRVQKYVREKEFMDEGNVPVKRPRLDEISSVNTSNENNVIALAVQDMHINANISPTNENNNTRKSPEIEIVPDPTKKFFKTNRTMAIDHKATVTVVNNVKIQVHNGKMALNSTSRIVKPVKKRPVVLENIFEDDAVNPLATRVVQETVKEVLQKLDSEIETSVTDDSHHIQSITTSTSSLMLHDSEIVNVSEPTYVGENQDTSSNSENRNPENVAGTPSDKQLYPVFYKRKGLYDSSNTIVKKSSPHIKKMRLLGENQYQIDAGQSRFRAVHCKECGTLYHLGDPEDEIAHYNIHNNVSTFRFVGWKHEHVIKLYENGERIIVVYPDDPKVWVTKAKDVLNVVDKEMGVVDSNLMEVGSNKVYLYVLKNRIVGVLAAEPKQEAYRMINTGVDGPDCCSEETYPVLCGISRIWTAPDQRRKGIATRLVDSLRLSFMFDHILDKKEIAFSVPTDNGKAFATNYMRTPEFMVYYK